MNHHFIKYVFLACFIASCSTVKLPPPSPNNQSILILPVDVVDRAQHGSHGFYYIYTIESLEKSAAPYEAVIKLPIKENMLLVDSLTPGRYAIKEFKFLPTGAGDATYGDNVEKRNDEFVLEPEKITFFERSLNVSRFNETVGRGAEVTYMFGMEPVSAIQKEQILSSLKGMPNYELWGLQNDLQTFSDNAQGDWIVQPEPEGATSSKGISCHSGPWYWTIDGGYISGDAMFADSLEYRAVGKIENTGTIMGRYFQNNIATGAFEGEYQSGELVGIYRDPDDCEGSWIATRSTALPDVVAKMQGEWTVLLTPDMETDTPGIECQQESIYWEIKGESLVGKGTLEAKLQLRISGQIKKTGTITGSYYKSEARQIDERVEGEVSGRYVNEALAGTYRDSNYCEGTWEATKMTPYQTPRNLTGVYLSSISGTDVKGPAAAQGAEVVIEHAGDRIKGSFGDHGVISGNILKSKIKFNWDSVRGKGSGEWYVSESGNEISGVWREVSGEGSGAWTIKYQGPYTRIVPSTELDTGAVSAEFTGNVTGSYHSQTTGFIQSHLKNRNPVVNLIQNGKSITGTFDGNGKIWGDIDGHTIKFDWFLASWDGRGKWTFDPASGEITGSWFSTYLGSGHWNLIRIE